MLVIRVNVEGRPRRLASIMRSNWPEALGYFVGRLAQVARQKATSIIQRDIGKNKWLKDFLLIRWLVIPPRRSRRSGRTMEALLLGFVAAGLAPIRGRILGTWPLQDEPYPIHQMIARETMSWLRSQKGERSLVYRTVMKLLGKS